MKIPMILPRQIWFAAFGIGTVEARRAHLIGPPIAGRVAFVARLVMEPLELESES